MIGRARVARLLGGLGCGALGALTALGSLACGDSLTARSADAGEAPDGGGGVRSDSDASREPMDLTDGSTGRLDAGAGITPGEGLDSDAASNAAACFDGRDQDGDGLLDCGDEGCAASRVCCVGSTATACCARTPTTIDLSFAGCRGLPSACVSLLDAGTGARIISGTPVFSDDDALVPVATSSIDGAIDFPSITLTPRAERISLRATIAAPASATQLDATGVGLWVPQLPAASVSPVVAIVVSATRGDVSLVVGTRVIDRAPLTAGDVEYTLTVEPDGRVTAVVGASTLEASIALPAGRVAPVLFGRVINDAAESGTTRVRALAVDRHACDRPGALVREGVSLVPDGGSSFDPLRASDPSVLARTGSPTLVAFVAADQAGVGARAIYLGERSPDGTVDTIDAVVTTPMLRATSEFLDAADVGGPHLYLDAEGRVAMLFAYGTRDGAWQLAALDDVLGTPRVRVLPVPPGSFDDPATLDAGRILARERLPGGGSRLVVLTLDAGGYALAGGLCASESSCGGERPDTFVHEPSIDPLAFDHDEVRGPVAIEVGGVTRIYFAGRRGTRWSVGMLVGGDDGTFFRVSNDGVPVLAPAGGAGPDSLGAAGPSPLLVGDELELVYAGTDGAHWQILSARAPILAR